MWIGNKLWKKNYENQFFNTLQYEKKKIKELNEIILFDMGYFCKSDELNL